MHKLTIPSKIHVGYRNRSDTYTGKLAYVIYTDEKNKVRKKKSWTSWRDSNIEVDNFENEPTTGFVLNKGVGGARNSWGWNARNEYIRVYDPRNFEFEISVANLLFILTHCNAIKGKGLEGEFVYAWDGPNLILLPTGCHEYDSSSKFTSLKPMRVSKSEMSEGFTYQHKDTNELVYCGRHKIRDLDNVFSIKKIDVMLKDPSVYRHVFYDLNTKSYRFERGFTKLAKVTNENIHQGWADICTDMFNSKYLSRCKIVMTPITIDDVGKYNARFYIKCPRGYQLVVVKHQPSYYNNNDVIPGQTTEHFWPINPVIVDEITADNVINSIGNYYSYNSNLAVSLSYINDKELFTPEFELINGERVGIDYYVQKR